MSNERDSTCLDRALSSLAARQHGVVSLAQLRALGLSDSGARYRVATGRLHPIHAGVYAVGHRSVPSCGWLMAAVLACGRGAVLSHRSAAAHLGIRPTDRPAIDVSSPRGAGRKRVGIDAHAAALTAGDVTTVDGIPCTTVARTLLDLAEVVDRPGLERAIDRAEQLRLLDVRAIEDVLARAHGRHGARPLNAVVAGFDAERARTRSELERRFLKICHRAGVPRPRVNHVVVLEDGGTAEVDFAWPDRRLAVETDGRATHGTRRAFEADRRRDQRMKLAGWDTVRFTWRQVLHAPREVESTLGAVVNIRGAPSLH